MDFEVVKKLRYRRPGGNDSITLPPILEDALSVACNYFKHNSNNKLCLVFPAKENTAQWLSVVTALWQIKSDFASFNSAIATAYTRFKPGDKVLLNNEAIVEWVGVKDSPRKGQDAKVAVIRTRAERDSSGMTISIPFRQITKLQATNRKVLSAASRVMAALPKRIPTPLESLLSIDTYGNKDFIKNHLCLIANFKRYNDSVDNILVNDFPVSEYFWAGRIDDSGEATANCPLLLSNSLRNLAVYQSPSQVAQVIIDGYNLIRDKLVDFNDIDAKHIPMVLITDVSDIDNFADIKKYGFDFFDFTRQRYDILDVSRSNPFNTLLTKTNNFKYYSTIRELCNDDDLEKVIQLIYLIKTEETVKELVTIKILLVQLTNQLSREVFRFTNDRYDHYSTMVAKIESFNRDNRFYLGSSTVSIAEAISILKLLIEKWKDELPQKSVRFKQLLTSNHYSFIICPTEEEVFYCESQMRSLKLKDIPRVISLGNLRDNTIEKSNGQTALLTGWPKYDNANRLMSCFLFASITTLFYNFEDRYLSSLIRRNSRSNAMAASTVDIQGLQVANQHNGNSDSALTGLNEFKTVDGTPEGYEFELALENSVFSKYIVRSNIIESVQARRVDFSNDKFIYLTDSHGLLVLSESKSAVLVHKNRIEHLRSCDIIAFLKTERELLNKIVEDQTTPAILGETTRWINLWKRLLKEHYLKINCDFVRLVNELKSHGCERDQATIRSWIFDDLKIGPRKDDDLISIAIMTDSQELYANIDTVRHAIRQMTSWRMKASDFLIEQLKGKIREAHSGLEVNSILDFENIGEIEILEIEEIKSTHDNIDLNAVNRLLTKIAL